MTLIQVTLMYYLFCLATFGIPVYANWEELKKKRDYKMITERPMLTTISIILFCWLLPLTLFRGNK